MECEKVFQTIDHLADEYVSFWVDVCNLESPTNFKKGVDAVGHYFAEKAGQHNWKVEVCSQEISGDCVCITMNPDAAEAPISLSGHMDTVHPVGSFGTPATHCDGDKIYGPGVSDCKGGIVAAFLAMDALEKCGFTARPVQLLLQSDEEISSLTSNKGTVKFMAEKSKDCIAFLNCEQYNKGKLCVARKGILRYEFEITGKAAHSSKCYDGANAICEAAHKIIELEKWKDEAGVTCNCGTISGGTTANSVPEKCTFVLDVRFKTTEQMNLIQKEVKRIAETSYLGGTTCSLTLKSQRCPMEKAEKNIELFHKIAQIFEKSGLPAVEMTESNGGSDAADITAYGIPCIDSIGVCGGNIHSRGEYAYISSLAESAKRLAAIAGCI